MSGDIKVIVSTIGLDGHTTGGELVSMILRYAGMLAHGVAAVVLPGSSSDAIVGTVRRLARKSAAPATATRG